MPKGKLIVLEGLDGCGKATQTQILHECMEGLHIPHKLVQFPRYDDESSALVRMYLNGDFGTSPFDVNGYASSLFYLVDQFASYKKDEWGSFYDNGGIVISDRYFTSNLIFQGSKILHEKGATTQDLFFFYEFIQLLAYFKVGIPKPDAVLYLKIHPEVSIQNLNHRYQNDESKKDIHEADTKYLTLTHNVADLISCKDGWYPIPVSKKDENGEYHMRDKMEIHSQIVEFLNNLKIL